MQRERAQISVDVVASAQTTRGAFGVIAVRMQRGATLPPHLGNGRAIDAIVLEGAVELVLDGTRHSLISADHVRLAPRVPRAVRATRASRVLCTLPAHPRAEIVQRPRQLEAQRRAAQQRHRLLERVLWILRDACRRAQRGALRARQLRRARDGDRVAGARAHERTAALVRCWCGRPRA